LPTKSFANIPFADSSFAHKNFCLQIECLLQRTNKKLRDEGTFADTTQLSISRIILLRYYKIMYTLYYCPQYCTHDIIVYKSITHKVYWIQIKKAKYTKYGLWSKSWI